LNLSDSQDFDPLRVTDLVASEFLSFEGMSVIPVNRSLAYLASEGKASVETPTDALELARAFDADATVVTAITEYDPYDPPVVGMVLQWYPNQDKRRPAIRFDPVAASRMASDPEIEISAIGPASPNWQIQRVFNAADRRILKQIRDFARDRGGSESPYGWRAYTKSQELYVRFCSWTLIRTITLMLNTGGQDAVEPSEAKL
jgi:hypothetical protein